MGAAAVPVLIAVSTAASAYGQYSAGQISASQQRYNARIAQLAAADARKRGDLAESRQRRQTSGLIGQQRSAVGASGFAADVGTAGQLSTDAEILGELDVLTIRNNAMREAWGLETQSVGYQYGAQLGMLQAKTGALSAGASGYADYFQYSSALKAAKR